jgi:hypothetical protein
MAGRTSPRGEYLDLAFSPLSAPLRSRWRNNGLSADFLGDYVTTFLPTEDGVAPHRGHQNEIKHAVTYIANELLENAMKYHEHDEPVAIAIHLELTSEHITISSQNGTTDEQAGSYKLFIDYLSQGEAGDLLVNHLEESAKRGEPSPSCLGLLTMISDYGAELGWRFETHEHPSNKVTVTTSAVLSLKRLSGVSA